MKTISSIIASGLLATATALTVAPPVVAQMPTSAAQTERAAASLSKINDEGVRNIVVAYEKAWNSHDMELLATLWREDAELINVVGMHWRGRDSIVKVHTVFHEIMFKDNRF